MGVLWVVKLGGSLIFSPDLPGWISAVEGSGNAKVVVVPGGGPFAEEVKRVQRARRFDDVTAHRMAVLATEQYGLLLCSLSKQLVPAATPDAIHAAHRSGHVPVWMAGAMTANAADIQAGWDVSSDSLAAWLARRMGAAALILVKSVQPPEAPVTADELSRLKIVDPAFPATVRRAAFAVRCLGPGAQQEFAQGLGEDMLPGVPIMPK